MRGGRRPGASTVLLTALMMPVAAAAQAPQPAERAEKPAQPQTLASAGPLAAIDACIGRLHPDIDVGYERIAARCPDLAHRLASSGWGPWLPHDWLRPGNDLSAAGLRELRKLLVRESAPRPPARALSVAPVSGILLDLGQGNNDRAGWWSRTRTWLRGLLARDEADEGWATRLIGEAGLPQLAIEVVSYVALALVVALAVVIVVGELHVAGLLRKLWNRRGGPLRRRSVSVALEPSWGRRWEEVRAAAPMQRPRLLLELIIARLTAESCLPPARGLTVRELIRAARLADEGDRRRLSELARVSEIVRFSAEGVSDETLAEVLEGGRVLLAGKPEAGPRESGP
ncbi:MAG TPA: DUF4129 domain-containing protein [Steroidobacteraceae bacterium]|nr:DUF4129 domain-containing protein [Steroidobacteraceae bacterium]